jgi:hypothetical protein
VGDVNGDFIDDIIFNNRLDTSGKGKLSVAIFNTSNQAYDISNFKETMVDPDCGGFSSQVEAPSLSTPHSVSMIDFDGDCLADLFMTV